MLSTSSKRLADLARGDRVVVVRTVKAAWQSAGGQLLTVVYDDDATEVRSLSGDPAVEVVSE